MIALALALLIAQDTPVAWEKIGGGPNGVSVDVSPLRTEGEHRIVNVRLSTPDSHRMVVMTVSFNCAAKSSQLVSDASVYVDGKFTETVAAPAEVKQERPIGNDPIAGPIAAHICRG